MLRAYLDACVAIYYVERHPTLYPRVKAALFRPGGEDVKPVFSDLTRMECRVLPMRRGDMQPLARYDSFFGLPDCDHVAMGAAVFDYATELRAQHALKTPDALHLAVAIHSGCDEFWTSDDRLAKAAARRIAIIPDCPLGRAMMARRMVSRFAHGRRAHSRSQGEEHGREDAAGRPPGRAQAKKASPRRGRLHTLAG